MNILVTGGTGFIGSHLVHALIKENHQVIVIKRSTSDIWRIKDILDKVNLVDLDNNNNLGKVLKENKVEAVIHLATFYVKNDKDIEIIESMIQANVVTPSLILNECIKNNIKIFINTGTCFEFKTKKGKIDETAEVEALNLYAATKLSFEEILKYYCKKGLVKGATLKLFYPYGEVDNNKIVKRIIESLINNKSLKLTKGEQKLDYTYVDDIVSAYMMLLRKIKDLKNNYSVFNIGTGRAVTIKRILKVLEKLNGKKSLIKLGALDYSANEIMFLEADNIKAKNILGWKPQFSIEQGLKKTYDYYIKNYKNKI